MMLLKLLAMMACLAVMSGCARHSATSPVGERQKQIERLQEFSREKGFPETGNFKRTDLKKAAYFLCYYAKKWELPDDYDDLGYREGNAKGCGLDQNKFDVYFHRVEAVAFEDTPVTALLEDASDERALMVAAHEEVHEDPRLERLPHAIGEAASTLLGMLTAAEFARREGDLATATHLSEDARIFERKARAVNQLHESLTALYAEHRAGKRSRAETSAEKDRLFDEAARACAGFGAARSINPCLPAANNAGLAFDHTYTRMYPLLYALYESEGSNLDAFLSELRELGDSEKRDLASMESLIRSRVVRNAKRKPPTEALDAGEASAP